MFERIFFFALISLVAFPTLADLAPCVEKGLNDLPAGAHCGFVTVPLSYDSPDQGSLKLKVVVLPARGESLAPDPVFYLVGGPGTAATESVPFFSDSMQALQQTRRVVLFDLRGTGFSGDFDCKLSAAERRDVLLSFRSSAGLEQCARHLKGRETLRTTVFAHDIDRVRKALGAEKINLMGVSYGTRLALEYARLYPDRLRASVLRGVSSPAENVLAQLMAGARNELAALGASTPHLLESHAQLAKQLEKHPVEIRVPATGNGTGTSTGTGGEVIPVDHAKLDAIIRFLLYSPQTAQSVPAVIGATVKGQLGPLAQVLGGVEQIIGRFSIPVLLGVLCAEDVPFWTVTRGESSVDQPSEGHASAGPSGDDAHEPFTPTLIHRNALALCRAWSVPPVDPAFRKPVFSEAPTLLLSGANDPATPAETAEEISKSLSSSLHLVTPGIGHFPSWTSCQTSVVAAFLESGSVRGLDTSCAGKPPLR